VTAATFLSISQSDGWVGCAAGGSEDRVGTTDIRTYPRPGGAVNSVINLFAMYQNAIALLISIAFKCRGRNWVFCSKIGGKSGEHKRKPFRTACKITVK
jgi:hypothetical protein